MDAHKLVASSGPGETLEVVRTISERTPADLAGVARIKFRRGLRKACLERLATFSLTELAAGLDAVGHHSTAADAVCELLSDQPEAEAQLGELLASGGDAAIAGLSVLFAVASGDAGRRDGAWKNLDPKPPVPALLVSLREHPALGELRASGEVAKGRVVFVQRTHRQRHG